MFFQDPKRTSNYAHTKNISSIALLTKELKLPEIYYIHCNKITILWIHIVQANSKCQNLGTLTCQNVIKVGQTSKGMIEQSNLEKKLQNKLRILDLKI
jgi:hypothetical protein